MERVIPTSIEDASLEVLARIIKSTSQQYGCSMRIDFSEGRREAIFIGDEELKPHIAAEVEEIFKINN
jgi:hypothetical protein